MKSEAEKFADSSIVEGAISILSILQNNSRTIERIFLSVKAKREEKNLSRAVFLAKKRNIPIELKEESFFAETAIGHTHGGILARVGERKHSSLKEIFSNPNGFVFLLCGIEDPFNFGSAVRSLYYAGADGMVLSPRNWLSAAGVAIRSSAGATEALPCAIAEDNEALCKIAKEAGYNIVCASEKNSVDLFSAPLKRPLFLVIGGEKRGITKGILASADILVRIPYGRKFSGSLTASSAAAVCGFEVLRQNPKK